MSICDRSIGYVRQLELLTSFPVEQGARKVFVYYKKYRIAHGLHNARKLLEDIKAGKCQLHASEIMACPVYGSGCIVDEYRNME